MFSGAGIALVLTTSATSRELTCLTLVTCRPWLSRNVTACAGAAAASRQPSARAVQRRLISRTAIYLPLAPWCAGSLHIRRFATADVKALLGRGICERPVRPADRERRQLVLDRLVSQPEVQHPPPSDHQRVGEQPTVAAPPLRLRAHDRGRALGARAAGAVPAPRRTPGSPCSRRIRETPGAPSHRWASPDAACETRQAPARARTRSDARRATSSARRTRTEGFVATGGPYGHRRAARLRCGSTQPERARRSSGSSARP